MQYSTPEVVVLGTAAALVLGIDGGVGDNPDPEELLQEGLVAGLDD
jgi:hypothetical protein